ncbi:MAG: hypothetical protein K2J40_10830 [Ruminococcus sp.]|nr:hypothetical protein [Ruminococcus sp.]
MNNEKDNIISDSLNNLDDTDVEKISENIPALNSKAQKRILKNCIKRMSGENITEPEYKSETIVSGVEKYSRTRFIRYISTVAACLFVAISIGGMILVNRNIIPPNDVPSTPQYTSIPVQSGMMNNTISSAESTVVNTVTTTVVDMEKTISEVVTEIPTKVQQVTEPITEVATEIPTEVQQVKESITEIATESPVEISVIETVTEPSANPETETTTEPSETEPIDVTDNDNFIGKYTTHKDSDSGSEIKIVKTDENIYHIEVKFYRIAYLSDGIGTVNNGILTFTTGSIEGCPAVTAEITLNDDGCILKIIESEHGYILPDNGMQYYRISE